MNLGGSVNLGLKMQHSEFLESQTLDSLNERQKITISSSVTPEIQVCVDVRANLINFTDYGHTFSIYFIYLSFLLPFRISSFRFLVVFINSTVIRCRHEQYLPISRHEMFGVVTSLVGVTVIFFHRHFFHQAFFPGVSIVSVWRE